MLQRSNSFESEEEQKEEKATREKISVEEERRDTTWKKESDQEETDVVRDVEEINEGPIKEDVARLVSWQKTPQTPQYSRTCLILDN